MTTGDRHHPAVAPLPPWKLATAAFAGGMAGSLARGAAELGFAALGLPGWASRVAVNVVGAFLIGCLFARIAARDDSGAPAGVPHAQRLREHLLGAGMLGGFTTVSGMASDLAHGLSAGDLGGCCIIVAANAVVGIVAAALGWRTVKANRARSGSERAR